jgi:hypothetical protein
MLFGILRYLLLAGFLLFLLVLWQSLRQNRA